MAQNIGDIDSLLSQTPDIKNVSNNRTVENNIDVNISIDKVQDFDDFIYKMQTSNKFEKLVQSMTIDRIAGKNSLKKHSIKF